MSEYFSDKRNLKKYVYFSAFILLYILLFEFLIPANTTFPGLSLIFESFLSMQLHYGFLKNALYTVSGIYLPMLAAYGVIRLFRTPLTGFLSAARDFTASLRLFKYFPVISIVTIYIYWFPVSNLSEILFTFLISIFYLLNVFIAGLGNVNRAYTDPFTALGAGKSFIYKNVLWKSLQPELLRSLQSLSFYLWTIVLFFEFIKGYMGIGNIYRLALSFNDISGLAAISILSALIIALGSWVIKLLSNKVIDWET